MEDVKRVSISRTVWLNLNNSNNVNDSFVDLFWKFFLKIVWNDNCELWWNSYDVCAERKKFVSGISFCTSSSTHTHSQKFVKTKIRKWNFSSSCLFGCEKKVSKLELMNEMKPQKEKVFCVLKKQIFLWMCVWVGWLRSRIIPLTLLRFKPESQCCSNDNKKP